MKNILQGIKNLIAWVPVIWQDGDFDYVFLLRILKFKLERMLPVIENGYNVDAYKTAHKMRIAIRLLDRQIDGTWYHDNAFMFHRKKYGEAMYTIQKRAFRTIYLTTNPEQAEKEAHKLIRHSKIHEDQDWQFLMDWLKKYLRNWWD